MIFLCLRGKGNIFLANLVLYQNGRIITRDIRLHYKVFYLLFYNDYLFISSRHLYWHW